MLLSSVTNECDFGFARHNRREVVPSICAEHQLTLQENIRDQSHNAAFMYPPDPWQEISANAIELINNFLWVQQRYRFTSGKSLIHPWLENFQTWVDLRSLKGAVGERYLLRASDGKSRLNNSKRANAANWWKIFTANFATERGLSTSFLWDSDAFISNELFLMKKYFNVLSLKRQITLRVWSKPFAARTKI